MKPNHVKLEDKGLVRDLNSRAILSTDKGALLSHRRRVKQLKDTENALNEINNMKEKVDELTSEISEIKNLLRQLIGSQN